MFLVLYDYSSERDDELAIKAGDEIQVINKNTYENGLCIKSDWFDFRGEDGWYCGRLNGRVGLFPENYGKLLGEFSDKYFLQILNFRRRKQNQRDLRRKTAARIHKHGTCKVRNGTFLFRSSTTFRSILCTRAPKKFAEKSSRIPHAFLPRSSRSRPE